MDSINEHLIVGGLLASIVVFLFMRNLRSTFIAAVSVPISIVATFTAMRGLDMTLNNLTMLGLTLAVGIVIDDAIVVLENIYRYIEEEGYPPMRAAVAATQEIGLAVMATTLSLVVIFLPVVFLGGIPGRFLQSFGLTMAVSILVSMLVSFTLTPMLSSRFLKRSPAGHKSSKDSGFYRVIDRSYGWMLRWALSHRKTMVAIFASSFFRLFQWECLLEWTSLRWTTRTNLKSSSRRRTGRRWQAPMPFCRTLKEKRRRRCAASYTSWRRSMVEMAVQ